MHTDPTAAALARFHAACRRVIAECRNAYARAYAEAGLAMTDPHSCQTQCLYIRNNLAQWRGEAAREVKREIDALAQPKKWIAND